MLRGSSCRRPPFPKKHEDSLSITGQRHALEADEHSGGYTRGIAGGGIPGGVSAFQKGMSSNTLLSLGTINSRGIYLRGLEELTIISKLAELAGKADR